MAVPLASVTFTVLKVGSRSSLKVRRNASGAASTVLPDAGAALSSFRAPTLRRARLR
jgi:hypothetical protein